METPEAGAALLRLVNGAAAAQVVAIAARLGLADRLAAGPCDAEALAAATATHAPSLRRLLRALAALGIATEEADGRFALGPVGGPLRPGVPGSVRDLVLLFGHPDFWATWGALEHSVRTGESAVRHLFGAETTFERYAADPAFGAVFDAGMAVLAEQGAGAVLDAWTFPEEGLVVDVGGGQGTLLAAVLHRRPRLRGVVLDLPGVAARAAELLHAEGLGDRARAEGGDMFSTVPVGADVYLLKSVLHDWADDRAVAVLRSCRAGMTRPAARLLVIERIMPERMAAAPAAIAHAVSDLRMLTRTGGRERTEAEFAALLAGAGLHLERLVPTTSPYSVLEAAAR
jgi:hypothetical protein